MTGEDHIYDVQAHRLTAERDEWRGRAERCEVSLAGVNRRRGLSALLNAYENSVEGTDFEGCWT